jgi:carbamoyl-phosphate synthase large subunit
MNAQFAVTKDGSVYVLEVNPRASRTVPFVSKATGVPWAKVAARVMSGRKLSELDLPKAVERKFFSVKGVVFPFSKFEGVDTILGPEMKSTGEVMGISKSFARAFAKAQTGAGVRLPRSGKVFVSVMDGDKDELAPIVERIRRAGFTIVATAGTAAYLKKLGHPVEVVNKVRDGSPHIVDRLGAGEISLVINTPEGTGPLLDSRSIRLVANELKVPLFTTMAAAAAVAQSLEELASENVIEVCSLQEYHQGSIDQDKSMQPRVVQAST